MSDTHSAGLEPGSDDAFIESLLNDGSGQSAPEPQRQEPAPVAPEPQQREPERIPLPEYLQERERRQAAEKRIADFEAAERKRQEEGSQGKNFWTDPEGYVRSQLQEREQQISQALLRQRVEDDEERVGEKYPDEFPAAQAWFVEQVKSNPALLQQFVQQRRPALWAFNRYRESQALQQIGPDPAAYRKKLEDELLGNPEFLARAMEAARGSAAGNARFEPARAPDGTFAPQQKRVALPSMRTAGAAAPLTNRPPDQSGDDLLDEVFSAS